ncbi:MAG: class I SAM-dependent methyltransferase [Planctomycetota bacterium]
MKMIIVSFVIFLLASPVSVQVGSPAQTTGQPVQTAQDEAAVDAVEESVKPGINDSFLDPELNVDDFVERFEVESREVFVARERILAECGIEKGDFVADVGAGTGLFTRMFSVAAGDEGWVYAVDISARMIEHVNSEADRLELNNVTGVLCSGDSVNLPPESVDVVFICDTYHHFEFPASTMASINRALKPDGHVVVIDFERIEGVTRQWLLGHVRAGKEVFRAEIEDAGFELVEEKQISALEENYFLVFRKRR